MMRAEYSARCAVAPFPASQLRLLPHLLLLPAEPLLTLLLTPSGAAALGCVQRVVVVHVFPPLTDRPDLALLCTDRRISPHEDRNGTMTDVSASIRLRSELTSRWRAPIETKLPTNLLTVGVPISLAYFSSTRAGPFSERLRTHLWLLSATRSRARSLRSRYPARFSCR
jgi:hypothetical protein